MGALLLTLEVIDLFELHNEPLLLNLEIILFVRGVGDFVLAHFGHHKRESILEHLIPIICDEVHSLVFFEFFVAVKVGVPLLLQFLLDFLLSF